MTDERALFMVVDPFDGQGPEAFYDACNEIERLERLVAALSSELDAALLDRDDAIRQLSILREEMGYEDVD